MIGQGELGVPCLGAKAVPEAGKMRVAGGVCRQAMQVVFEDVEHDPLQQRAHVRRRAARSARVELLDMRKQPGQSGRQIDCVRLDGLTIGLGDRNLGVECLNVRVIEKSAAKGLVGRVAVIRGGSPLPSWKATPPRCPPRILPQVSA